MYYVHNTHDVLPIMIRSYLLFSQTTLVYSLSFYLYTHILLLETSSTKFKKKNQISQIKFLVYVNSTVAL